MSRKSLSLSEKLNELLTAAHSTQDSEDELCRPQVTDFDCEEYELPGEKSTEFRKKNVKLLSEQSMRYRGKLFSRQFSENDSSEESDRNNESISLENDASASDDVESEDNSKQSSEEDSDSNESDEDERSSEETVSKAKVFNKANEQAEILKGLCVQNQLHIWERLLEMRIHSQKLINKANQLPIFETDNQVQPIAEETSRNLWKLMQTYLELQRTLTKQYPELETKLENSNESSIILKHDDNGPPPLKRIAACIENRHANMKQYRNTVLLKWDDRTKLLTPGTGSNKRKAEESFDVIRKIENALANRATLIEKSQIVKTAEYKSITLQTCDDAETACQANESAEHRIKDIKSIDKNVYDDSDFYYQQLRELIEYKANNSSTTAEVTKQYVELQNLRQKMKKKVDQRASKGRKLRYIVHKKLINFMAPDDMSPSCIWTDEAKDELYKSLFTS